MDPKTQAVIDAARELLGDLVGGGAWYSDCWALSQALDAYDAEQDAIAKATT